MATGASADTEATAPRTISPVAIDASLCKACGICSCLCPKGVLEPDHGGIPVVAHADECTLCRICELHCPEFALSVRTGARRRASGSSEGES
jgi:2-oxoglutarate ferredoxin oxidoreductase subunit delta